MFHDSAADVSAFTTDDVHSIRRYACFQENLGRLVMIVITGDNKGGISSLVPNIQIHTLLYQLLQYIGTSLSCGRNNIVV